MTVIISLDFRFWDLFIIPILFLNLKRRSFIYNLVIMLVSSQLYVFTKNQF
jgi:hypothetical protein